MTSTETDHMTYLWCKHTFSKFSHILDRLGNNLIINNGELLNYFVIYQGNSQEPIQNSHIKLEKK